MNSNNEDEKLKQQTILTLDDDFSLIKKFNEGDINSFSTLINRHREKVRNLIYLTLGNTYYIDDISQEVFISVFRKLKYFRYQSQFTTWLYRVTVNKCRDHIRKMKIRTIFSPFNQDEEFRHSPSYTKEEFDTKEIVRKHVADLPEGLRIPLVLKDFEGLSYQEIGESLKIELGTVKSRIFRAREALKKSLEPFEKEIL